VRWCRRIWELLDDEHCRRTVETAERYADGLAGQKELAWAAAALRLFVCACCRRIWELLNDEHCPRGPTSQHVASTPTSP